MDANNEVINSLCDKLANATAERDKLRLVMRECRIALSFYRQWMTKHCPEGNGSTTYPFGIDAENAARLLVEQS